MSKLVQGLRSPIALGAAALLAMGVAATAAESPKARAAALQALVDCRSVADPARRLACYDAAAGKLEAAEASGDVVVVDRAQVQEAQRAAFGFNFRMPSFMTGGGNKDDAGGEKKAPDIVDTLETTVASARKLNGRWIIRLPDGAVWVQTDDTALVREPKVGSKVLIKRGAVGSYFLSVDGQRSMRAKREN